MQTYSQLTYIQRYQIYALLRMRIYKLRLLVIIDVDKFTIGREFKRDTGQRGYRARQKCIRKPERGVKRAHDYQQLGWSLEQIDRYLRKGQLLQVNHEWIYQHKRLGGELRKLLRCQKKCRERYGSYEKRGQIPHRM